MIHDSCLVAYGKLNKPAPKSFREKLKAWLERQQRIDYDGHNNRYLKEKTRDALFSRSMAFLDTINWINAHPDLPDPSLAEFKAKLKGKMHSLFAPFVGTESEINMHRTKQINFLWKWIDDN